MLSSELQHCENLPTIAGAREIVAAIAHSNPSFRVLRHFTHPKLGIARAEECPPLGIRRVQNTDLSPTAVLPVELPAVADVKSALWPPTHSLSCDEARCTEVDRTTEPKV